MLGRGGCPVTPDKFDAAAVGSQLLRQHGGERGVVLTNAYRATAPLALCLYAELGWLLGAPRSGSPLSP
eukprot:COSAG01_NODE_23670_length_806_cov_1.018388_2_plen_69_part_00